MIKRRFVRENFLFTKAAILLALILAGQPKAQSQIMLAESQAELKKLSIEQLLDVDVTSVSKRPEPLLDAPTAIQIITQDDIHRSTANSIPEALRLASNLQVAQINAHDWAISARGFNGIAANKLLVMMDGRTLYTPLFSGVFWDVQDTMLENIDRIEVISGPGATLWGANAVNGVVNIITKKASDPSAQGLLASFGGGSEERGFENVRYAGKLSDNAYYRVYEKYFNRDSTVLANGSSADDAWQMGQTGFRIDWDASKQDAVTFQGDYYQGIEGIDRPGNINLTGGNFLNRWSHSFAEDNEIQLQCYYDRTDREIPITFKEDLNTFDIDFQHRIAVGERNELVWGMGYRLLDDHVRNTPGLAFLPPDVDHNLFTSFVQDKITLVPKRLFLTAGTKVEDNPYTGIEIQPSARIAWDVTSRQTIWTAVSRAVRTPSRIDRDAFVPGKAPFMLAGGPNFTSEKLIAYELGYRAQLVTNLSGSISGYYNDYTDLRSTEPGPPATFQNKLQGHTYGIETELSYQALSWWRLNAGYNFLQEHIHTAPGGHDLNLALAEGSDPKNQFQLRSLMDLPHDIQFDLDFRYVDTLTTLGGKVPQYVEMDARLAWLPRKNLELSVVGQNLLHDHHAEFGPPDPLRNEIQRGVYGKVTWRF